MRRPWEVSRRALLRGGTAAIGLPMLETMVPGIERARAAGAPAAKYLVFYIIPFGTSDNSQLTTGAGGNGGPEGNVPGSLWPKTQGSGFEPTRILQPLVDRGLRDDLLVISNLHNGIGEAYPGMGGDHPRSETSLLTQVDPQYADSSNRSAGISVDQVAANALGQYTPALPSLLLCPNRSADNLFCWSGPTSLLRMVNQPTVAFKKVFENCTVDSRTYQKRLAYRQSVLHSAKQDIDRLKSKLGRADLQTLDKYLTGVGELEKRIAELGKAPASTGTCTAGGFTANDGAAAPELLQQMLDIVAFALQADRTRVAVIAVRPGIGWFSWLGTPNSNYPNYHDDISHGSSAADGGFLDAPDRAESYVRASAWMVDQFGYLMKKLKDVPSLDGQSSLLRSTIGVCVSEMSNGNGHNMRHLPVVLAGQGGGPVTTGRYVRAGGGSGEEPISNLWLSLLNTVGVNNTKFGANSTAPLSLTS